MTQAVEGSSRGIYAPVASAGTPTIDAPRAARRTITSEQLQKMRDQQTRQQKIWSICLRAINNLWVVLKELSLKPLKRKKVLQQCDISGHVMTRVGMYDFAPVCRFCGRQVESVDELRHVT